MSELRRTLEQPGASGLRPAAAFVSILVVLLAVLGQSAWITLELDGAQPDRARTVDESPEDHYTLVDRTGRVLGLSLESFDLSVSPRSMWRAHTPRRIAAQLAELLGEDEEDVLHRLLPGGSLAPGVYQVERPRLLAFDETEAARVLRWIRSGATEDHPGVGPIDGLDLVALGEDTYTLCFAPATLFSRDVRLAHMPTAADRPSRWTKRLLDDLASLIELEPHAGHELLREHAELDLERGAVRISVREALWQELFPSQHRIVARRVEPLVARAIDELRKREAISSFQLSLEPTRERRHPLRPDGDASFASSTVDRGDAFELLGSWGVVPAERSAQVARAQLEARFGADALARLAPARRDAALGELKRGLETSWRPWSGIERAAHRLLERPDWGRLVQSDSRAYRMLQRSVPRDRHESWRSLNPERRLEVPNYYLADRAAGEAPVVVTTLDAGLQQALHERLLGVMEEHDPALAMGIVLEVATGAVLAADGIHAYDVSGFAPLTHSFTPGSTFKAVVMASALDEGVVKPDDSFATYAGSTFYVREGRSARSIGEAEGAPTEPYITATDGLAESVNAVLVQIGMKLDDEPFRRRLEGLGYGLRPASDLGPASGGLLPKTPWTRVYTQASLCFGHEVLVTLWQHAASLATIARGGEYRPLRVLERVEHDGRAWSPAPPAPRRVLSERACSQTLEMLAEGARRGTGAPVAGPEVCPEFAYIGTKTGTTERSATEFCLHVELPHAVEHARIAAEDPDHPRAHCSRACKEPLRHAVGHRPGRASCYTSSMLAIGRLPGDDREVLVLVVVEDARSRSRFGRDVAGKATIDMLREAFDLPAIDWSNRDSRGRKRGEDKVEESPLPAFPLQAALNHSDQPWLDGVERRESWSTTGEEAALVR